MKPIIFTGESVQAILAGTKTMTRRVVKFPKHAFPDGIASVNPDGKDGWIAWGPHPVSDEDSKHCYPDGGGFKCPYGKVGDQLWVKETWVDLGNKLGIAYKADSGRGIVTKWKSPIFMPRWASRITLEITGVRVERLQDISEEDAFAEGIEAPSIGKSECGEPSEAIYAYMRLWNAINAKRYPWESNCWVWAISFKAVRT